MINIKTIELPKSPGVYKFLNNKKETIYVGKSKDLSKRVKSYFQKNIPNRKVKKMVNEVDDIKFIISIIKSNSIIYYYLLFLSIFKSFF